jgi:predicted small lipoprotein YifL
MNQFAKMITVAALVTLAGCGGKGDDAAGDAVADNADAVADSMDNRADVLEEQGLENQADALENKADAVRAEGKRQEEAIDDADINASNAMAPH